MRSHPSEQIDVSDGWSAVSQNSRNTHKIYVPIQRQEYKKMTDTIPYQNSFAEMSPSSSFSSDASSCGKSSPNPSSIGIRRSTMDLSNWDASGLKSPSSSNSSRLSCPSMLNDAVSIAHGKQAAMPSHNAHQEIKRGIESIIDDTFLGALPIVGIAQIVDAFLSFIFKPGSSGPINLPSTSSSLSSSASDSLGSETFSPCRVKLTQHANGTDDWDHFADFQDEMDDASISFVPFAKKQSAQVLETLDEIEEDEEGEFF